MKNAQNGAFLAHPEPEILLIEVAYFSAATEYTFSAHCIASPIQPVKANSPYYVSLCIKSELNLHHTY